MRPTMKAASTSLATFVLTLWPTIALAQIRQERERVDLTEIGAVVGLLVLGSLALWLARGNAKPRG